MNTKRRKDYTGIDKVCERCGKHYNDVPNRRTRFCSQKCVKGQIVYICKNCGKAYLTSRTRNITYCSRKCMFENFTGRIMPKSFGKKVSIAKLHGTEPTSGRRIRKLIEWSRTRKNVLERDGFTCQICFGSGIEVHHIKTIKNNPELAYITKNLITLCKPCHTKLNSHEKEWEDYFNKILK